MYLHCVPARELMAVFGDVIFSRIRDNLVLLCIYTPVQMHYIYPGSQVPGFFCCNTKERPKLQCVSEKKSFCIVLATHEEKSM